MVQRINLKALFQDELQNEIQKGEHKFYFKNRIFNLNYVLKDGVLYVNNITFSKKILNGQNDDDCNNFVRLKSTGMQTENVGLAEKGVQHTTAPRLATAHIRKRKTLSHRGITETFLKQQIIFQNYLISELLRKNASGKQEEPQSTPITKAKSNFWKNLLRTNKDLV